jgi:hypothetical protein
MDGQQKNANDYWFNPDGSYNSAYQNTPIMGYAKGIGTVLGAALGFGAIGAAAGGATAAGEGIGAANAVSDAAAYNSLAPSAWEGLGSTVAPSTGGLGAATGESIGAANAVSDASAYGSLSPAAWESAGLGSTVAPATGALGAGSGVFNPAVDSQLANATLGQTAADVSSSTIPSVTVNGAATPRGWMRSKAGQAVYLVAQEVVWAISTGRACLGRLCRRAVLWWVRTPPRAPQTTNYRQRARRRPCSPPGFRRAAGASAKRPTCSERTAPMRLRLLSSRTRAISSALKEGENALTRAASANGTLGSGKYLKDAMAYNQGQASQEFGNSFNRLLGVAGMGQTATGSGADYLTQGANASAAGKIGGASAINNGLTQGYSMYSNNQLMNRLFPGSYQGVSNPYTS